MVRLVVTTVAAGAAVIAAAGAAVALVWDVTWGNGIGAVCVAGTVLWMAIGLVAFLRWVVAGRPRLPVRAGAAAVFGALIFGGLWIEVPYAAHSGCGAYSGVQPLLTVPISLVIEEPVWERSDLFDTFVCADFQPGRAYEVGPFGDVPGD